MELPLILEILSPGEVSGIASVEVKFVDIRKNTSGEGGSLVRNNPGKLGLIPDTSVRRKIYRQRIGPRLIS